MPGPLLIAAVPAAIGAVSSIFGAKSQSNASKRAAEVEAKSSSEALADARAQREYEQERDRENTAYTRQQVEGDKTYTRGQYADYLGRLTPYANAGAKAVSGLSANFAGRIASQVPASGNQMIKLADSRGRIREVPASQADVYIKQGAVRV